MKRVEINDSWPASWKQSYFYDLIEIYGHKRDTGYVNAYSNRMLKTLDLCKKSIPYGGKILDLAAAQGNFSLSLAEMGYEVTWNDLRDELADYVRLKQEKGTIHFVPGNIFELPFKKEFDAVILCEVIEHVAHPDELLKVAASFLKDGGHMILSTPNADYCVSNLPSYRVGMDTTQLESLQFRPNSDGHLFLFDKSGLESLAKEAGLVVIDMALMNNLLTCGHIKTRYLLKILPRGVVNAIERMTQMTPLYMKQRIHAGWVLLLRKNGHST